MKNYIILGALSVFAACNQPATKIAATVEYDDAWQLESLLIKAKDTPRILTAQHDLTFVIPDDWAGAPVTFEMWGLVGDANKKAYAQVEVTPVLDDTVDATLSLKLLDCSTPCTVGAVRCDGDAGVATCLAVDGCGAWSQPVACPTGTPFCSAGTCAATCADECTMGTVQCDGTGATKTCGQADADSCLDWQTPVACPAAQTCSGAGVCSSNCTNDCTAGATRCDGTTGVQTCGQADADSCLEWQPSTVCPAMQACSANACRPVMTCANPVPNWKKETPRDMPPVRDNLAMAFDAVRDKVVLFGGSYTARLNDTWSWDGTNWKAETPRNVPPARYSPVMAFDAVRNKVVLFGGANSSSLNDTWTWDGTDWKGETPRDVPRARNSHAMAFDSVRNKVVLFGGYNRPDYLSDTWTWDGANWKAETPRNVPPGRSSHTMAFDSVRQKVVLFGGSNGPDELNDTWTWDGVDWKAETPINVPPVRYDHAMAFDSMHNKVVIFGGSYGPDKLNDTWTWDGVDWKAVAPRAVPLVGYSPAMAFDAARNQIVLFSGANARNDTWTLDWTCP